MLTKKIVNQRIEFTGLAKYLILFLGRDVLFSLVLASIVSIFISVLYQRLYLLPFDPSLAFISIFIVSLILSIRNFKKENINIDESKLSSYNFVLFFFVFFIGIYRSSIYFHFIDDYVQHVITGFYLTNLFTTHTVLPASTLTYIYPLLPYIFYKIISVIGFRMSLLFFLVLLGTWYLSINLRLHNYFEEKKKGLGIYVNIFFIFLFFLPELISTFVVFGSDFFGLVFFLEFVLCVVIGKINHRTFMYGLVACLCKMSSGLFIVPIFIFFVLKNIKRFDRVSVGYVVFFLFCITSYNFFVYVEIGSPLGALLNNYFKSPIYVPGVERDFRWGPHTWSSILTWPLIGYLSKNFVELVKTGYVSYIYSLFISIPFLASILLLLTRKIKLGLLFLFSLYFWSFYSGYGRYQVAMTAGIWVILFDNSWNNMPVNLIKQKFALLVYLVFAIILLGNVRYDYAIRGFIINPETYMPSRSRLLLLKEGISYYLKDSYSQVYSDLKLNNSDYKSVYIYGRGISSLYAMLIGKEQGLPIYSSTDYTIYTPDIVASDRLSDIFKKKVVDISKNKPFLLVLDKDYEKLVKESRVFKLNNCKEITRDKLARQFQSGNYFNYVIEYRCE